MDLSVIWVGQISAECHFNLDVVLHYFPSLAGPMYCKLLVPSIRIIF